MLSYRHAFHVGNHGDVLKHMALIQILQHLTQKDGGILAVDTHAGAGLYRLDGDMAKKSSEASEGVLKLISWANSMPNDAKSLAETAGAAPKKIASSIAAYLELLGEFNPKSAPEQRIYPGSPFILHHLLRPEVDKIKLFELHPTDYPALSANVRQLNAQRMVNVDCANGFERLKALLPPPAPLTRSVVLIDPSYELKSDYAAVATVVKEAVQRFPTGSLMLWYPIIPRPEAHGLPKKLKTIAQTAKRHWLNASLNIGQEPSVLGEKSSPHKGMRASGVFVINPPHALKAALQEALPQLVQALGRGRGKGSGLESG